MSIKTDFISAYFDEWEEKLIKAKVLLDNNEYYLEGILVLSCYIGAFSRLRFPSENKDWKAYKRIVLEYSGKQDFYKKIDLLFFYQWPRSSYKNDKIYQKLKNYRELVNIFIRNFGDENEIKTNGTSRYPSIQELLEAINSDPFTGFDNINFTEYMELYSLGEILYRYVRCHAVHEHDFPLITKVSISGNESVHYRDNHALTGNVIYETVLGIFTTLKNECLSKDQWPYELPQ